MFYFFEKFYLVLINLFLKIFKTLYLAQVQTWSKKEQMWLSFYKPTFNIKRADRIIIQRKNVELARAAVEEYHQKFFGEISNDLFYCYRDSNVYTLFISFGNRKCSGSTFSPGLHIYHY